MISTLQASDWWAGGILVLLVVAVAGRAAWRFRTTTRYTWPQAPIYLLNLVYTRVVWRAKVEGTLPRDSGAVIVSNHRSSIDPLFIQLASDRIVHWMVAREYALHPLLAWAFRITESIPVSRGGVDTAATKMTIRYAQQGGLVGLFPEGRINMTQALLLPGRPGAALIALRAKVPVIPCYVEGAPFDGTEFGCFLMTAKTRVKIGEPIDLSDYYGQADNREVQGEITKLFLREIAALAGVDDWQGELAGRRWSPKFDQVRDAS